MDYTVKPGDCLTRIAASFGFRDYRIIYDHPENAAFRAKRKNPNVIQAGDRLFIPDRDVKAVGRPAGAVHTFTLKRPRKELRLVLLDPHGKPITDKPYKLVVGDKTIEKRTGEDGLIHELVPIDAEEATLIVQGLSRVLRIGDLDPMKHVGTSLRGIKSRLANLGFDPGSRGATIDEDTRDAIKAFQESHDLDPTGEIDDRLIAKLEERHAC